MMGAQAAYMRSRIEYWRESQIPAEVASEDILDVLPGFLWHLDRNFRFTYVSEKALEVSGLHETVFLGASLENLGFAWASGISPLETRAGFRDQWVTRTGSDGRRVNLSLSAKPLFGTNEGFLGYVGTGTAGELPLELARRAWLPFLSVARQGAGAEFSTDGVLDMFSNATECLTDGFALFGPDDRLIFCNTSYRQINENAGWPLDGETHFEAILRANVEAGLLEEAIGREEAFVAERMARHRAPDDEARLVRWTNGKVFLIRERKLANGGVVAVNTDLTELVRNEKALSAAEEASRAKSAFLARTSHELRTPLNAIIGFSDLVLSETFGPLGSERYRNYIGDVKSSGEHLLSLINDLLDLTGIESGRREFLLDAHHPRDLVSQALRSVRPIGRRAGVRLRGTAPASLLEVKVDTRAMHQCLLNLVSNAIKATPGGGRVAINVEPGEAGTVVFTISDTGKGMTQAMIAKILGSAEPPVETFMSDTGGAGLGLPITKSLVEIMGGRLEIASTPGIGTHARLIVPTA